MAIETTTSVDVKTLPPFKRFIMSIGALPTSYLESMTYAELIMWFCNFLQEQVIPAVNNNADAIKEIQNFLNTLDLQDEVDHKLDEMAESGQLQEMIAEYLNANALWCFDNVSDMKQATNLINGSFAKTLGYLTINDNGGALYKIREITNEDVVDEGSIIALDDETLVAQLIIDDKINILNFGYTIENATYNAVTYSCKNIDESLINCIAFLDRQTNNRGIQIYFPDDTYLVKSTLTLTDKWINMYGNSLVTKTVNYNIATFPQKIFTNINGALFSSGHVTLKGLNFMNIRETNNYDAVFSNNSVYDITECHVNNYDTVFNTLGFSTVSHNSFLNCRKYFINGTTSDSTISQNYINAAPEIAGTTALNLTTMGVTLLEGNFIDFFKTTIYVSSQITGSRIVDNIFDYTNRAIKFGGAIGLTISNNSFLHISKTYYDRLHYSSSDPEYSNNWICIETAYTLNGLTITGNIMESSDQFVNIPNTNATSVIIADNNAMDYTKYGTFSAYKGSKTIQFKDMNDKVYSVQPTATNTYYNQTCYYNGTQYKNVGEQIVAIGLETENKGVAKAYTTSGGGNYSIDMTNFLNGALYSSIVLEIRTSRGYYSPTLARYNIIKIGGGLTIIELFNNSPSTYKTNVTASGTTLNISFSGTDEEDSGTSKQVFIRTYGE